MIFPFGPRGYLFELPTVCSLNDINKLKIQGDSSDVAQYRTTKEVFPNIDTGKIEPEPFDYAAAEARLMAHAAE